MRLAIVLEQLLAPIPGGTGRYSAELARSVAAVRGADTVLGVTAWHRDVGRARIPGVDGPVRLTLGPRVLARGWQRGVGPRPWGVDVVHAPTPLAPPRGATPLVVTVHDDVPFTAPQLLTGHGAAWHRAMIGRAAVDADVVVVPSDAVRLALDAAGVRPRRVVVCPPGVSDLRVPADAADRVARLVGTSPYIICVGTFEPRKGIDVLLDALVARPALPDVVLVGRRGWGDVDPVRMAAERGVSSRVHVLEGPDDATLAALLASAAVAALPSRGEGFGLPLVEAMSLGVRVVASDLPVFVEVAADAATFVPVDDSGALADALQGAIAGEGPPPEVGRVRAARFTWSAVADTMWQLYRELAS